MTGTLLVLDLDGTLWDGPVAERGGAHVVPYRAFQERVRYWADCGVTLAVATHNDPADARAPFEAQPDMPLSLPAFAAFAAGWGPKADMIVQMARQLRPARVVFFDDSAMQRRYVAEALPEVIVVDVPIDVGQYPAALDAALAGPGGD